MIKEIVFYPAYDKTDPDPKKNYGVNGVEMAFFLKGEHGAIQFKVLTNWNLPHVQKRMDSMKLNSIPYMFHKPMPSDIGYHSRVPQYDGQEKMTDNCPIIGGECYYDGSGLQAEKVFDILVEEGSEGVWKYMENDYEDRFIKTREVTK